MNRSEQRIKDEQSFINLLLTYKDLVGDWQLSTVKPIHFDVDHRIILLAIEEAFGKGSLLTREGFLMFVRQRINNDAKCNAYMFLYDKATILDASRDSFPVLMNKILESYVLENAVSYVDEFRKGIQGGAIKAVVELAKKTGNLVTDSSVEKAMNSYESIADYAPKFYDIWCDKRDDETEHRIVTCGIREIDETMVVGFAPGTLTLFCSDVGGFKSLVESCGVMCQNGSKISIGAMFKQYKNTGLLPVLQQLDLKLGKLVAKKAKDIVDHGLIECVKIKTRSGNVIENTLKHRHFTFNGYKETENLKVGDYLATTRLSPFGDVSVDDNLCWWIGCMLSDGGTSCAGYRFTNFNPLIVKRQKISSRSLGGNMKNIHSPKPKKQKGEYHISGLRHLGKKYEIDGKLAINKNIPRVAYEWDRRSLVTMLKAMYSCDGSISFEKNVRKNGTTTVRARVIYSSSSYEMARSIKDILLKFGMVASIFEYISSYKRKDGSKFEREAYRVVIQSVKDIVLFVREIGFTGDKQTKAENIVNEVKNQKPNPNKDIIPPDIWHILDKKYVEHGKTQAGCRIFYRRGEYEKIENDMGNCGNKGKAISRRTLVRIAEYLDNDKDLLAIANSDIYWDKIVSITPTGKKQTYDIEMPCDHNFVAENIVTHNSTMMMNIANNIWNRKYNVLFVPLEMPRDKMFQKFLSLRTNIAFDRIEKANILNENEAARLKQEIDFLQQPKDSAFYIMETYERVPVSIIRREIEKNIEIFKPDLVVVDYIANLIPDQKSKETRPDLQIGEMLKDLRTMGRPGALHESGFAIVSAAQIGREALKRMRRTGLGKTSFYSEDLRGSQELSADADNIYAQMPDESQPDSRLQFFVVKARYGKKVFNHNETRTALEVHPEISLIKSVEDQWLSSQSEDVMKKVEDATVSVPSTAPLSFPDKNAKDDSGLNTVNVDDIIVDMEEDEDQ